MPYKQFENYSLYYEVSGEGKPLIFLHGLGGCIKQIKDIYQPIEGIQLIVIDQKAHGNSRGCFASITFDNLASDVIAIADILHIKEFIIAGISMGAAVSLKVLLNYPDRVTKAFLIRNAWINKPMKQEFIHLYDTTANYLRDKDKVGFINSAEFISLQKTSIETANSFIRFFSEEAALIYYHKFHILPKLQPFSSFEELHQIQKDVTILSNHHDPIHPFAYGEILHTHIQNSRFYEIASKSIDRNIHITQINHYLKMFLIS